jgi:predicted alpha/beta superfamily hydrolase
MTSAAVGAIRSIHSKILNEHRRYWVYTPLKYEQEDAKDTRYPVLVHLDGQWSAKWSPGVLQFMIGTKRVPATILVGVCTMDEERGLTTVERTRDMTPTHSLYNYNGKDNATYRKSGRSATFLRFLEEELLPAVDREYRTLPHRAIIGLSLAGCFALDLFLTGRSQFQAFVALDPCLWWDRGHAGRVRDKLEPGSAVFDRGLYLAFSGTSSPDGKWQREWFTALADKAGDNQARRLRFGHYAEDSHGSMHLPGFYDGVRFVFGKRCGLEWD